MIGYCDVDSGSKGNCVCEWWFLQAMTKMGGGSKFCVRIVVIEMNGRNKCGLFFIIVIMSGVSGEGW